MNYYGAAELAESFRTVRKNTIQTVEDIPEDQYGFVPATGARSVAQTLVHIALSRDSNSLSTREMSVGPLSKGSTFLRL